MCCKLISLVSVKSTKMTLESAHFGLQAVVPHVRLRRWSFVSPGLAVVVRVEHLEC
jgi:hypothetical protein